MTRLLVKRSCPLLALATLGIASCGRVPASPPAATGTAAMKDDPAVVAAWETLKRRELGGLGVAAGWASPELVPGEVNTIGWEDSAWITPDGAALYFFYFPGDLFHVSEVLNFHRPVEYGGLGKDPARYSEYHRGPVRGVSPMYTSDSFGATRVGEEFRDVTRFPWSRDGRNEWGPMQAADGDWYYVSHDPAIKGMNKDLYRNDGPLPIADREKYNEDNPHFMVTEYGRELFFACKDRPVCKGETHIFVTREENGVFTEPVPLAAPVNVSTEDQPFLAADGTLYFSSARDGVVGIYASKRTGENRWGPVRKLLWPTRGSEPRLWGVGEPTLTDDGNWLYFVGVFQNEDSRFDADVIRVRRAGAP